MKLKKNQFNGCAESYGVVSGDAGGVAAFIQPPVFVEGADDGTIHATRLETLAAASVGSVRRMALAVLPALHQHGTISKSWTHSIADRIDRNHWPINPSVRLDGFNTSPSNLSILTQSFLNEALQRHLMKTSTQIQISIHMKTGHLRMKFNSQLIDR